MKTKEQRYNELYSSGLVDSIKELFANRNDISEDYYVLMADYIDSMNEIKDEMLINPTEIARRMPELVKSIRETNLGEIYGRTDDNRIQMEQSLSYEDKKLYFFHELTHALQTSHENGREQCGFYNGHDGMFLTEGATQYTAEMLYNVSNGTNLLKICILSKNFQTYFIRLFKVIDKRPIKQNIQNNISYLFTALKLYLSPTLFE